VRSDAAPQLDCGAIFSPAVLGKVCHSTGDVRVASFEHTMTPAAGATAASYVACSRDLYVHDVHRMNLSVYLYPSESDVRTIQSAWAAVPSDSDLPRGIWHAATNKNERFTRHDLSAAKGAYELELFETDQAGDAALCDKAALRQLLVAALARIP
jgi:hypothetical protein